MSADNQPHPTHFKIFIGCLVFLTGLTIAGIVDILRGGPSNLQVVLIVGGTAASVAVMAWSDRYFRERS